jgi:hypothetical protein
MMKTRTADGGVLPSIDCIGDIHGELPALEATLAELGYEKAKDWKHPEGRRLLFLGDLVDRGAHSLEVSELVMRLTGEGRAACIMGNHEYNLVAWDMRLPGYEKPKHSNARTVEDVEARRGRWNPVLGFFRALPLSYAFEGLRVIHACWHRESLEAAAALRASAESMAHVLAVPEWGRAHLALTSPFTETGLKTGLPPKPAPKEDAAHEVLIKGYEVPADRPFQDSDGKVRTMARATWWLQDAARTLVLQDDAVEVVGHYWNLPPVVEQFCPPFPSGHPDLRSWQKRLASSVPSRGRVHTDAKTVCVDYNGLTLVSDGIACVGAYRWPEREVVWATAARTRTVLDD